MSRIAIIALILIALLFAATASARILNVPDDFQTMQAGINASRQDDTVLVQPGTYDENVVLNHSGVVVGSLILTTGDPAYVDSTIIDGSRRSCVVSMDVTEENGTATLRGFTIRNGRQNFGGGVDCQYGTQLFLEDLKVTENTANRYGGGIYSRSGVTMRRVTCLGNTAVYGGGGIAFRMGPMVLEDCAITSNHASTLGGGLSYISEGDSEGTTVTLRRCVISHNSAPTASAGAFHHYAVTFESCTIAQNYGGDDSTGFGGVLIQNAGAHQNLIHNSIFYGNGNRQLLLNNLNNAGESPVISYCDFQGGRDQIDVENRVELDWGDGNLDQDPHFVDGDNGDDHLRHDSPCIDVGDPDSAPDPDGTRADMGALALDQRYEPRGFLGGQVLDAATGEPLQNLRVTDEQGNDMVIDSLEMGTWHYLLPLNYEVLHTVLTVRSSGYLPDTSDVQLAYGDSLWIETRLYHSEFVSSRDNLTFEVDSGSSAQLPLIIGNDGNGPLTWQVSAHAQGDIGFPPWSLRHSYAAADNSNDTLIQGAVLANDNYYLCGANGNDSNMIYVMDRNGSLVNSYQQCGNSNEGFKDLGWDGELIWGSNEQTVYGFTLDGHLVHSWNGPYNPNAVMTWDSDDGFLWIAGAVTDISANDRDGRAIGFTLSRKGLHFSGLAYWPNDPDGYKLYIVDEQSADAPTRIYKMNTETGDTMLVCAIPHQDGSTGMSGAFITNQFDDYNSCVMLMIDDIAPANGGDQLKIFQIQPNVEWLTASPDSGQIAAGGQSQVTVNVRTVGEHGNWGFKLGEYNGEIVFTHDAEGGQTRVPVHLTVRPPNSMDGSRTAIATAFGITSLYPNPFNGETKLSFALPISGKVRLAAYDLSGREVATLVSGQLSAGSHTAIWNAGATPAGVYLVKMKARGFTSVRKLILVR